ncbi:MAG: ATP-binding protein [Nitrospirae bacterium]|nr:ATP-binding protein [Nitrospirota bacterium]
MALKITKHDIGAEVISILTKGIYPDPRDALREYIQNGVDADAQNIEIKIRTDSIAIEDDGFGMDKETLEKAIRVGISDKNPSVDVGFRGIGIYSSFHLCKRLDIYSKPKNNSSAPSLLSFDFHSMRNKLNDQQSARLTGKITSDNLIDLQSLLQDNITLSKLEESDYKKIGTRIEMVGLEPIFFKSLSKFEEVADYLQQVVPLHFNSDKFRWAKKIEDRITTICKQHNAEFKLINLTLQVHSRIEKLYRPYTDEQFKGYPNEPFFKEVKNKDIFFGVTWGCLNPARKKIGEKALRGFLIKKQGFAIGDRADVGKYFGRTTFFDRYIGEVIVVHRDLLPNAARSDFEISPLSSLFYEGLNNVASYYNNKANEYQEYTKGDEQLDTAIEKLKELYANAGYFADHPEHLVDMIVEIRMYYDQIKGRLNRKAIRSDRINDAESFVKSARTLEKKIQELINQKRQKTKILKSKKLPEIAMLDEIKKLPSTRKSVKEKEPENLLEVFESLDLPLNDQLRTVLELIDERYIQGTSVNKEDYIDNLKKLKSEIEDLFSEE